ncbi:peptidyl-prolyl cis-trans isomerase-like 3 isoform X2 [Meriones unguiculatus]|uniref:peptidyl-prolyl cis-trans isomerase-like 3 isoform X2 n=1 Tax=Meriones unguiculatus TaxID=10047 RepID=UPI00293E9286|nr:peptidyl-prolyl cis-trans isomerase-like 3 isoform X2 [Meriones unguiculatus]
MSVTLHTDVGDIKIEVFCERTPKTCENFLALCASNYYNGCVFHRNIKGFMVQTGDPTGTGRGGSSIWGKKFEDEYSEYLKHNVRGVVSMANNGPNTNGSQFFITYGKQPHLDMKYTVFGKVSLCSPGCSGTDSVNRAGLKLSDPPAFAGLLKMCDTTSG